MNHSFAIAAVLFDFHCTLVDPGDPSEWLAAACQDASVAPSAGELTTWSRWLDGVWDRCRELDPHNERDLSPAQHARVLREALRSVGFSHEALVDSLYTHILDAWRAYDDTRPTLQQLARLGVAVAVVSNTGMDIRPVIEREDLSAQITHVVMSFDVGVVKPDPRIFQRAIDLLGVRADEALMVGDHGVDDSGGAVLGIRSLILPRTRGSVHGLGAVADLVVAGSAAASAADSPAQE